MFLYKFSSEVVNMINPIIIKANKIPWVILHFYFVTLSSIKILKIIIIINPNVWPPNSKVPPDVAYPIGKVVWDAKSMIVVKNGNTLNPNKPADI